MTQETKGLLCYKKLKLFVQTFDMSDVVYCEIGFGV